MSYGNASAVKYALACAGGADAKEDGGDVAALETVEHGVDGRLAEALSTLLKSKSASWLSRDTYDKAHLRRGRIEHKLT